MREARSRLEACKTARARWQRAQEVALQGTAALRELETATRQVRGGGRGRGGPAGAREALDRARQARDDAEALVAHQGRLRELAQEGQRLEARLEERARAAERAQRLEQELVRLRGERQQAVDALNALAPLATEQEQLAQRLAALQALQARGGQLQSVRQTVEDLQEQGVDAGGGGRPPRGGPARSSKPRGPSWPGPRSGAGGARSPGPCAAGAPRGSPPTRRRGSGACWTTWPSAWPGWSTSPSRLRAPARRRRGSARGGRERGHRAAPQPADRPPPDRQCRWCACACGPGGPSCWRPARPRPPSPPAWRRGTSPGWTPAPEALPRPSWKRPGRPCWPCGSPSRTGRRTPPGAWGAVEQALAGEGAGGAGEEEAYLQARAAVIAAEGRLREAAAELQGLPDGATLGRRLAVARRELQGVERACLDAGRLLGLDGPDADAVLCAVPAALAAGQQRSHELAEATGQRNALQARRLDVERLGLDYKHQLQECRDNLQRDEEEALVARRVSLDAERETVAAEGARLYAGVAAGAREWARGRRRAGAHGPGEAGAPGALLLESGARPAPRELAGRPATGVAVADALPDVAGLRRDLGQRYDRLQGEVAVLERQAQAGAEAEAGTAGGGRAPGRSAGRARRRPGRRRGAAWNGPTADLAATAAEAGRRAAAAEAELAALDEPAVQAQEHTLQREIWGAEEELRSLARDAERQVGELLDLARQLGHEAPDTVAGEAETAPRTAPEDRETGTGRPRRQGRPGRPWRPGCGKPARR